MTGGEGMARMRVLQAVVLVIFGVIALRLAYIQLFDRRYVELAKIRRASARCWAFRARSSSGSSPPHAAGPVPRGW